MILPVDITGSLNSQVIKSEKHHIDALVFPQRPVIVPYMAPFYEHDFLLSHVNEHGIRQILKKGIHYTFINPQNEAIAISEKEVFSAVLLFDQHLAGVITVDSYRSYGQVYTPDVSVIRNRYINEVNSKSATDLTFDKVRNKPEKWNPIEHHGHTKDFIGLGATKQHIEDIYYATRTMSLSSIPIGNTYDIFNAKIYNINRHVIFKSNSFETGSGTTWDKDLLTPSYKNKSVYGIFSLNELYTNDSDSANGKHAGVMTVSYAKDYLDLMLPIKNSIKKNINRKHFMLDQPGIIMSVVKKFNEPYASSTKWLKLTDTKQILNAYLYPELHRAILRTPDNRAYIEKKTTVGYREIEILPTTLPINLRNYYEEYIRVTP